MIGPNTYPTLVNTRGCLFLTLVKARHNLICVKPQIYQPTTGWGLVCGESWLCVSVWMRVSVMVGFLPWQINFAMAKSIFAMKEELMVEIIVEKWQKHWMLYYISSF